LRETKLDKDMKEAGFWPLWQKSVRGREPSLP
jgi:hypothetical protein